MIWFAIGVIVVHLWFINRVLNEIIDLLEQLSVNNHTARLNSPT